MNLPKQKLTPFLSFSGNAEEAMEHYTKVFDAKIESIVYFEAGGLGDDGKVLNGLMDFDGFKLIFMDMPAAHPAPDFSWANSLFMSFESEAAFDKAFAGISEGGTVMMGPEAVNEIRKCTWVIDKYGVTWQLVWK